MNRTPLVQMRQICRNFPGVLANDRIDFCLYEGEVHALLGENGSGKTTLMNVLYGLLKPNSGQILVNGKEMSFRSPSDAISVGIGMVHQDFKLIPSFTVADNITLCLQATKDIKRSEVKRLIVELLKKYEIEALDPDAHVEDLPAHQEQLVEILKMLSVGQKILIFDEPTSVLAGEQKGILLRRLRRWAKSGYGIVFISHKLDEVLKVSDRITVLRKGKVTGTVETSKTDQKTLVKMMIGHEMPTLEKSLSHMEDKVLEVQGLRVLDYRGLEAVSGVSFSIQRGEILGFAGVAGNGQEELVEAIAGTREASDGKVTILGHDVTNASSRRIAKLGVSFIPPKPKQTAVCPMLPITQNILLREYSSEFFSRQFIIDLEYLRDHARKIIADYSIATPSEHSQVGKLSGGNLMKLVVGREISREPALFIVFDPTLGLDVGSIQYVQQKLLEARKNSAILLVSTDLDEVLAMSDRVVVMFKGRLGEVTSGCDREKIGLMMAGADR
ncbi:ABC transporter ATP-binding protein [Chloroflexota bacterium]